MAAHDHPARARRARLHALLVAGPRRTRIRTAIRAMSPVFESGAANGAITAYGWRGAAVVPIALVVSALLSAMLHRRLPA